MSPKRGAHIAANAGYTFVETVLSIVILGMMSLSIAGLYTMGLEVQSAEVIETERTRALRSKMEYLLAVPFDNLASGTATETWNGEVHTITWTVTPVDMNADTVVENNAKTLVIEADGRSVSTLIIRRSFTGKM